MAVDHLQLHANILMNGNPNNLIWSQTEQLNGMLITFMHAPHDSKCQFDIFKRLLTRYNLPQNDAPAEYITFLCVCATFEDLCNDTKAQR